MSVGRVWGLWRRILRRKRDNGLFRRMDGVVGVSAVSDPVGCPLLSPPLGAAREESDTSMVVVGR